MPASSPVFLLTYALLPHTILALIPIFPGDKLHGTETNASQTNQETNPVGTDNAFSPWSPCTATCAPSYRVRRKLHCNTAVRELCSEVKACERKLPECGGNSVTVDVHLSTGQAHAFKCPSHNHEPALRLAWYRWANDTWRPFLAYAKDGVKGSHGSVAFQDHTLDMALTHAAVSDGGSYKCVLLYPDGRVRSAQYYHVKVTQNYTILTEVMAGLAVLVTLILTALCVWGFCLPGSKAMLPCFKVDPSKKMSELYNSRSKEEGIIKWNVWLCTAKL